MSISGLAALANGTITGTFTGGPLGSGSFSRTVATTGNTETIDTTRTNASGQSITDTVTITRNADGSITRDTTYTNLAGKTVTRDLSFGALVAGVRNVTGSETTASGAAEQITGTLTRGSASTPTAEALTLTNAAGKTETLAVTFGQSGSVDTTSITGTGFNGAAINRQVVDTILSVTNTGTS